MNIDHIFDYSCIFADYIWTKDEHFIINNLSSLIKSNRKNLLILFLFRRLYNHWLGWDFIFHRRHKYIKARLICCLVCCRLDHLHILQTDRWRIFLFLFKYFIIKVLFHFFMTSSKFHWKKKHKHEWCYTGELINWYDKSIHRSLCENWFSRKKIKSFCRLFNFILHELIDVFCFVFFVHYRYILLIEKKSAAIHISRFRTPKDDDDIRVG